VAAGVVILVRDPHRPGSLGICPSAAIGVGCPGCGSLRAAYDLMTGDLIGAWGHNVLTIPALAWLGWWWASQVTDHLRPGLLRHPPQSSRTARWVLVVLVVFTLARNVPGSPLAP